MAIILDPVLVDTNVALRWSHATDPLYGLAAGAVEFLVARGHDLCVASQNLIEFWKVSKRPARNNGYGLTVTEADRSLRRAEAFFRLLEDGPQVYSTWRQIVVTHGVSGVQVHDARLAACMRVHWDNAHSYL